MVVVDAAPIRIDDTRNLALPVVLEAGLERARHAIYATQYPACQAFGSIAIFNIAEISADSRQPSLQIRARAGVVLVALQHYLGCAIAQLGDAAAHIAQ
jgi:hypothetical protein